MGYQKNIIAAAMASSAAMICSSAVAQTVRESGAAGTDPSPQDTSSDIIVTAQKRSERLNDVPISITAATGEQLTARGVVQVADLEKVVPGFTYQPSNYGTPVFTIRGIGFRDNAIATPPTVAVYVDQVPLAFSAMAQGVTLDLSRVEALKGPQGTLFGSNSTAGAINFIANKPTSKLESGVALGFSRFDTFTGSGFVSGPLGGSLKGRLALATEQGGGWQRSQTRDATLGHRNSVTGRIILDWDAGADVRFEFNANGWINKSDTQAAQFVAYSPTRANGYQDVAAILSSYRPAGRDARAADWDPNTSFRRDDRFGQLSLRGDWDVSDTTALTSITAYSSYRQDTPVDPDGTAVRNFFTDIEGSLKSFSQELRLSGRGIGDRLIWTVGGNYSRSTTDDNEISFITGSNNGIGPRRYNDFINASAQKISTYAGFVNADFKIVPNLTATGALRYTKVNNSFFGCARDSGNGQLAAAFVLIAAAPVRAGQCGTLDANRVPVGNGFAADQNQDNLSWRGVLSWKPDADTLLYGSVTRGYKAGSFPTVAAVTVTQLNPVGQESVLAYEAGFKSSLMQRRFNVSGAAFYYDYSDKQQQGFVSTLFGNLTRLVSIPKSRVQGAELAIDWRPVKSLTVSLGGTYVDSKVKSNFVTNDPFGNLVNLNGDAFPNSPRWQGTADVQYDFALTGDLFGYFGVSPRYRSRTSAAFGNNPSFVIPAYGLLDLRAGVTSETGQWRFEVFGRNVTNKFYTVSVMHVVDTVSRLTGMPATYGVLISKKF